MFSPVLFQAKSASPEGEAPAEASTSNTLASIDIGDVLPSLTLKNEKGEDIEVADLAKEKGVVLFLVPKADTRQYPVLLPLTPCSS